MPGSYPVMCGTGGCYIINTMLYIISTHYRFLGQKKHAFLKYYISTYPQDIRHSPSWDFGPIDMMYNKPESGSQHLIAEVLQSAGRQGHSTFITKLWK